MSMRPFLLLAAALALAGGTRDAGAQAARPSPPRPAANGAGNAGAVERGDYLTHHVAMCVECHSPRDRSGAIVRGQEFRGAPNPFPAPFPGVPWAIRSVNIRGLGDLPEEAIIRLLTTGIARNGSPPEPPMPRFGMSLSDAQAIVAYLRSLD
jgi:mono/diheme cytochrome c family protein